MTTPTITHELTGADRQHLIRARAELCQITLWHENGCPCTICRIIFDSLSEIEREGKIVNVPSPGQRVLDRIDRGE